MMIQMERVATQTLLGIRFWDPALDASVSDGLYATAQMLNADRSQRVGRQVTARPTQNGIYAFFGLRDGERPSPDSTLWEAVPPERFAVIDVADAHERYLPTSFLMRTPLRGPFRGEGDWLARPLLLPQVEPGEEPGVYLWSAAGRPAPTNLALIQGQIVVGTGPTPPPAPYAVVRVLDEDDDLHAVGITDEAGRLMLPFAYPAIPDPPNNDPYPSLGRQIFTLSIQVHYEPDTQTQLPGSLIPDMTGILGQATRPIAILHNPAPAPGEDAYTFGATLAIQLQFGLPHIVRTPIQDQVQGEPYLRLLGDS